jgi:type II secretory pathway component PulK
MSNTGTLLLILALVAIATVIVAGIASRRRAQMRSAQLRTRFGPEYERAVDELGSPARAERELAARTRRVEHIQLRELSAPDRARYASAWGGIQTQFVDDPTGAVVSANELIKEVMRTRGYPIDDFDQRVADLSVDHATVVQHYRAARALAGASRDGQVHTEELRQAFVHYRALFSDLLQDAGSPSQRLREVHA